MVKATMEIPMFVMLMTHKCKQVIGSKVLTV